MPRWSASPTAGQYMEIGGGSGCVSGVASTLASDAARKFADGEQVTCRQAITHAACGATLGATAGAASGFVSKYVLSITTPLQPLQTSRETLESRF